MDDQAWGAWAVTRGCTIPITRALTGGSDESLSLLLPLTAHRRLREHRRLGVGVLLEVFGAALDERREDLNQSLRALDLPPQLLVVEGLERRLLVALRQCNQRGELRW